ncbi:hypothetical protein [Neorhizobium sp. JUb45]|uniref:hypothetical protein n=1 Tax=Neorhizobium sp. JUb45 TaxID=2485113 RepID=UPI001051A936|nr:hypothetical protein [Neorhizobium sp. JUb45]TCQ96209.1 hypothetical protein EDF70_11822 [Neorhizobium sp. JUb45]
MQAQKELLAKFNEGLRASDDHIVTARLLHDQAETEGNQQAMEEAVIAAGYAGQAKGLFNIALRDGFSGNTTETAILKGSGLLHDCERHLAQSTEALKATRT